MNDVLKIDPARQDDRFSRFELISWWDQQRLADARIVVVGAGALGNEILKNLALLGIGRILLVDFDRIEHSNLSRSVLFRETDCGRSKAHVAAERTSEIHSGTRVEPLPVNVVYDLGLGAYRWADVIIGGLDNREARVAINQSASRAGRIWIDGAIERLDGVARVFDPACGPCYECTMNDTDWKMLEARRSCALLSRDEMEQGKVPTTPTTSSIVAGFQCQEAVKLIHGMDVLAGQGIVYNGLLSESYQVAYTQKDDCPCHDPYDPVDVLDDSTSVVSAGEMLERVRSQVGPKAVIEFNSDLLQSLDCPKCDEREPRYCSLGSVRESDSHCPTCGELRVPHMYHSVDGTESFLDNSLADLGVPPWDVVCGREGMTSHYFEFVGDAPKVLGSLV